MTDETNLSNEESTPKVIRGALQVIGGAIPFAGGLFSAAAGAWSENEQERVNKFFRHWIKMLEDEIKEKERTILEIMARPNPPIIAILPELSVTKKFKRPNGTDFEVLTTRNISNGHGLLSRAMWTAFRNPIHHELASDLKDSGLYTEQDCLDALGLLSHLFRRLDSSEIS